MSLKIKFTVGSDSQAPNGSTNTGNSVPETTDSTSDNAKRKRERGEAKKHRRTYVPRDDNGDVIFPIVLGNMQVHKLGVVRTDYHTSRYIWPVGYESSRENYSYKHVGQKTRIKCTIIDGGDHPLFQCQTLDDLDAPPVQKTSPTAAWLEIIERIQKVMGKSDNVASASGPECFGFVHPAIARLIECLPGADDCSNYRFQYKDEPVDRAPPEPKRKKGKSKKKGGQDGGPGQSGVSGGHLALPHRRGLNAGIEVIGGGYPCSFSTNKSIFDAGVDMSVGAGVAVSGTAGVSDVKGLNGKLQTVVMENALDERRRQRRKNQGKIYQYLVGSSDRGRGRGRYIPLLNAVQHADLVKRLSTHYVETEFGGEGEGERTEEKEKKEEEKEKEKDKELVPISFGHTKPNSLSVYQDKTATVTGKQLELDLHLEHGAGDTTDTDGEGEGVSVSARESDDDQWLFDGIDLGKQYDCLSDSDGDVSLSDSEMPRWFRRAVMKHKNRRKKV